VIGSKRFEEFYRKAIRSEQCIDRGVVQFVLLHDFVILSVAVFQA